MTVTARERAFELFKAGFNTSTKIRKLLLTEGEDIPRPTIENWRRRDKWDGRGGVEALKAVAKQIRKAKDIGKRASQIPAVNEAMHVSIEDALNELGVVAFEGAQTIRAMLPGVADKIKTVAEFNSFMRTIAEVASLTVTATVELFKVMPDGGPGGRGGIIMDGEYAGMSGANAAIEEFRRKHG